MNNKELSKWSLPFMAWELRLYLDTHPEDTKALEAYRQICATLDRGAGGCGACNALPKDPTATRFTWVDDPWPWQAEANKTSEREG